ncbi:MAG: sugar phosphate isomerase/epimerase [Phycisphaerae bacterium]|nr:sugar phosphate isomerase/epimerase [Phycisphaerae bacterium]
MKQPLAIQSWCYREFQPLNKFLDALKKTGVQATELCGIHADFSNPQTWPGTIDGLKSAGVTTVAIGVEYLSGDFTTDEPRFRFCKEAGIKNMSISFKPEAMFDGVKNIEKLADKYDLQLGIHNHGGYDWLGNPTILEYIFKHTGKRIGLHIDTAWAMDAKQNPVEMIGKFADRLVGVHLKDFDFDRARQPSDVVIGTGNLDLPKFMQTLKQMNFSGPLVIEYEGDASNPIPALSSCVQAIEPLM